MSLYVKLIDNPSGIPVKPMEVLKERGKSGQWESNPTKKKLLKIHDLSSDQYYESDDYIDGKNNDPQKNFYVFRRKFSGGATKKYEIYHPRYPKKEFVVTPKGSTTYQAKSGTKASCVIKGNRIEIRLDPHHLVPFNGLDRFAFGANLAWLDGQYGHDLGKNVLENISAHLDPSRKDYNQRLSNLSQYFKQIRNEFKSHIVRFWLFERCEGLIFTSGQVQMESTLKKNVKKVLEIARKENIYIYWCLLSSHPKHTPKPFQKDKEIIQSAQNPSQSPFLTGALKDFIDTIMGHSNVFAVDVMNEPEKYISEGGLSWAQIKTYVKECCQAIKKYSKNSILVSCGSAGTGWLNQGIESTLKNYKGLGLDFYDFHCYNDTGELKMSYDDLYGKLGGLDKPCIIGEFGQDRKGFLDDFQKGVVKNFMEQTWNLGYGGCLVWDYNHKNFDYQKRNDNYRHSLIYRNGSPRPVKDSMKTFDTAHAKYTDLGKTAPPKASPSPKVTMTRIDFEPYDPADPQLLRKGARFRVWCVISNKANENFEFIQAYWDTYTKSGGGMVDNTEKGKQVTPGKPYYLSRAQKTSCQKQAKKEGFDEMASDQSVIETRSMKEYEARYKMCLVWEKSGGPNMVLKCWEWGFSIKNGKLVPNKAKETSDYADWKRTLGVVYPQYPVQ